MISFFTVCNRYHLAEAIALGDSIRTHHPTARYVIGYADSAPLSVPAIAYDIIPVEEIGVPYLTEMSERYYDFEFVHAVRPWFAQFLFKQSQTGSEWVFLTPVSLVCRPLDDLVKPNQDFLLTANILEPLPVNGNLDDKRILNIGMFNANAWMAKNTEPVRMLLDWWASRTVDRAFFDLCDGMCLDQLWLNYVPIHVPAWGIIRDPLWRLGLNNTPYTQFTMQRQLPSVNGVYFFTIDFTGLQGYHPVWSDHHRLGQHPGWQIMHRNYKSLLENYTQYKIPGKAHFGKYAPISILRNFRKAVKSELDQIVKLIDKVEI